MYLAIEFWLLYLVYYLILLSQFTIIAFREFKIQYTESWLNKSLLLDQKLKIKMHTQSEVMASK
jgi:hypothetical protein